MLCTQPTQLACLRKECITQQQNFQTLPPFTSSVEHFKHLVIQVSGTAQEIPVYRAVQKITAYSSLSSRTGGLLLTFKCLLFGCNLPFLLILLSEHLELLGPLGFETTCSVLKPVSMLPLLLFLFFLFFVPYSNCFWHFPYQPAHATLSFTFHSQNLFHSSNSQFVAFHPSTGILSINTAVISVPSKDVPVHLGFLGF